MLPNKLRISEQSTIALKKLQGNTGITVNIGARLAFSTSFEQGFLFDHRIQSVEHTGRELDKHTWLGDHVKVTEALLKSAYPTFTKQQLHDAWAAHIDDGSKFIDGSKNLASLAVKVCK